MLGWVGGGWVSGCRGGGAWIDTRTCSTVDDCGFHSSHDWRPVHVPRSERQTLPFSYRFGLMRSPYDR